MADIFQNSLAQIEDENLRPYTTGTRQHEDRIATLILFSNEDINETITLINRPDYFDELGVALYNIVSESVASGTQAFPETPSGTIPMLRLDDKNNYYGIFNNFSVNNFVETHDQITKIHMNFGAKWNVFLFGNTPNMYRVSGVFLDTQDYPYYQEFMIAYEKYLSGRQCVERGMQLKLMISGQIIDGFLLNVSVNHTAAVQQLKEFSFTFLVKGSSWVRSNFISTATSQGKWQNKYEFNGLSNIKRLMNNNPSLNNIN